MRELRNSVVAFAKEHNTRNRRGIYSLHPTTQIKVSIRLDSKSLYLLFAKSYNIHTTENTYFTNYLNISTENDKRLIFANFFDISYLERILKEQKLHPTFFFIFSNKHSLQFLGIKNILESSSKLSSNTSPEKEKAPTNNDSLDDHVNLKETIRNLNEEIKDVMFEILK
ncbi:uncharacterized protein EV154DRAFT_282311 [Mucor mucedo]|uniref:uncharacterized protein n=1 Tax=Mucor mucedo TaxID=29922 RepID=UPI00221FF908|nr:uncharacterized protein EV154DRAFT_282311 [Mucor mucedo]KAI7896167.1 hypothetical protein EV154DRAFT_282311 [Mucor mucedo]